MPITMNNTNNTPIGNTTPIIPGKKSTGEWTPSEHNLVYFYIKEGVNGPIEIQLPGLNGVENLPLQKEYNNGTDVAEAIKEQNSMTLRFQKEAESLPDEGDYIVLQTPVPGLFAKVFKPSNKNKPSYDVSAKNLFHTEMTMVRKYVKKDAAA